MGFVCMAFPWAEMVDWMKRGCQEDGFFQQKVDRRKSLIATLDITLLDDIGSEGGTNQEHSKTLLRSIVDSAIAKKHSLVMTSNLTPTAFASYVDASTLSRLSGWGEEVYEPIGKEDFRQVGI
jgi:DNA replication protein DnaC